MIVRHILVGVVVIIWMAVWPLGEGQASSAENEHGQDSERIQDKYVELQLERIGSHEVENYWQQVKDEYDGFLPDHQPQGIKNFFQFEGSLFSFSFLTGLFRFVFQELLINVKLLGSIILLTVFSMILQQIQTAFENNSVSKVAYAVTYLVIFILAINSFYSAMNYAKDAISSMVHFMMALIPLILALMATTGSVTSVSLFHPLIIFLVHTSGVFIYSVIFPLLFFSAILGIVSAFSDQYKVTQLSDLLRNVGVGLLGIFLTIFLGVVSVQGATSAIVDGVTIKAAKFVTGNFVPIVGRMFTDATDTVIGASLLVKNTVGLAGVFILVLLCIFPALKVLTIAFVFHLAAAILQPLGESNVITCLNVIGKSLLYVFAALATVGLMFFLAITIIITAGNLSVMVR